MRSLATAALLLPPYVFAYVTIALALKVRCFYVKFLLVLIHLNIDITTRIKCIHMEMVCEKNR
jgi:hypothetical protein